MILEKQTTRNFIVGDWLVKADEGILSRGSKIVRLEPKVMEVLVYFSSRAGEVITRDELERDVWKGAIVGYDAITKSIIKLRKGLEDDSRTPHYIATISKKGYQLISPVSFSTESNYEKQIKNSPYPQYLIKFSALLLLVAVFWLVFILSEPSNKTLPVVLVLPFENKNNNKEHDIFVDGMTEDVITDLSKISNLLVLSSNASFQYKGKVIKPQELRKTHNIDYILKGTIRRIEKTLKINVQVIDAKTNINIWAERYNRNVNDFFLIRNELVHSFVNELELKLTKHDVQQLITKATTNLKAYDHFLEGQQLSRQQTKSSNVLAREAYQRAIEIDPSYSRAYGAIAYTMALDYRRGWTNTPNETLDRALALAEQATLLNKRIPQTYWALGYVHLMRKEFEDAEKSAIKSIVIAPNYADGYGLLSLIYNNLGQPKQAIKYVTKGMQLNPYYTWDYPYNLGRAHYTLGNYDKAITTLELAQERNETAVAIKLFLAASYVRVNRIDDAEWTAEQLQTTDPNISISLTANTVPIPNLKLKNEFLNDLRKSGMPE